MTDTTTPAAAVESLGTGDLEGTLESVFGGTPGNRPEPTPKVPKQEAPEGTPENDLSPDDLLDDEQPTEPVGDAEFEIVWNGQAEKVSRDEVIRLAQQGKDYTQKTQFVAERARQVDAVLQRTQALAQIAPMLAQEVATIKALESQLQQYNKVDWVRLATEDPLEYPKHRAQYDMLVQGYQQASGQLQQRAMAVSAEQQAIAQWKLQNEAQILVERIPEWRDPARYAAGAQELASYLVNQGADPAVVDSLSDSLAVTIARKAMLYDKLVSAKAAKSKQVRSAPPVVRPGANAPSDQGRTNFQKAVQVVRKAGRQNDHRMQERAMEAMLGKAFPK